MPNFCPPKLSTMTKLITFVFLGAGFYATHAAEKIGKTAEINMLRIRAIAENQSRQPGRPSVHVVSGNETLFSISKKYGVTVDDIRRWNNLKDNSISVGQSLTIRGKAAVAPSVSEKSNAAEQPSPLPQKSLHAKHTVAPKETLFSIAKQYGVSVANLKEWNDLGAGGLKAGSSIWVIAPVNGVASRADHASAAEQNVPRTKETKENAEKARGKSADAKETDPDKPSTADKQANASSAPPTDSDNDSGEVKESGNVALMENADKTKYLCWHKNAPVGSILKVKNLSNGKEVFVRVQGRLELTDTQNILRISSLAAQRLGESAASFKADVSYYK